MNNQSFKKMDNSLREVAKMIFLGEIIYKAIQSRRRKYCLTAIFFNVEHLPRFRRARHHDTDPRRFIFY